MNPLFLVFIAIPSLEIFLMIKIGGIIGALNTVSLIFLTAVLGIYFAKLEGLRTIRSGITNIGLVVVSHIRVEPSRDCRRLSQAPATRQKESGIAQTDP